MPRAVQRATAADVPYSMSSGCATTQSTRWKDSSGRAGNAMPAILPEPFPARDGQAGQTSSESRRQGAREWQLRSAASDHHLLDRLAYGRRCPVALGDLLRPRPELSLGQADLATYGTVVGVAVGLVASRQARTGVAGRGA